MTEHRFVSQDSDMGVQSRSSTIRTVALFFCGLAFLLMVAFMFRIDTRQERYLDYGIFLGKYESEGIAARARSSRGGSPATFLPGFTVKTK